MLKIKPIPPMTKKKGEEGYDKEMENDDRKRKNGMERKKNER